MYEVPKSKASIKQNRFEFKIDGKVYSVPLIKYLPVETVIALSDSTIKSVVEAFGELAPIVRQLDQDQLDGLSEAWVAASGISVGESSASETS